MTSAAANGESAACAQARRDVFADDARCFETVEPDLTTPAGKVLRLIDENDPRVEVYYALLTADGAVAMLGSDVQLEDAIEKSIHYRHDVARLPAWQRAHLLMIGNTRQFVIRCREPSDVLPGGIACTPPNVRTKDGLHETEAIVEIFPHPDDAMARGRMIGRAIWRSRSADTALENRFESLAQPEADAPRPASLPPQRGPLPPPNGAARPQPASAEDTRALCEFVASRANALNDVIRGAWSPCRAFHYPSLDVEGVAHYFLQGSSGNRPVVARRKGGAIEVMTPSASAEDLLATERALLTSPDVVTAETLLALHLLYTDARDVLRCRTGAGDVLPGGLPCEAPTLRRSGGRLTIAATIERRLRAAPGVVSIRPFPAARSGELWRARYELDDATWKTRGATGTAL